MALLALLACDGFRPPPALVLCTRGPENNFSDIFLSSDEPASCQLAYAYIHLRGARCDVRMPRRPCSLRRAKRRRVERRTPPRTCVPEWKRVQECVSRSSLRRSRGVVPLSCKYVVTFTFGERETEKARPFLRFGFSASVLRGAVELKLEFPRECEHAPHWHTHTHAPPTPRGQILLLN